MKVYFDNASTTPILAEVVDLMTAMMREEFGNPSSIHSHGRKTKSLIEDARKTIANLLNASIGEIFFTSSATEATNTIFHRAIVDLGVKRIISSPTEHHCVLNTIEALKEQYNIEVVYLDVDVNGQIDCQQLSAFCKDSDIKTMVSLMYGNNEIGTMLDINRVSKIAEEHGALFHCDAVQVLGKTPIDLDQTKVSFLTGCGHKFHGPKGVGFFYMNNDNIVKPYITGGAQERNMRAGTENLYGIAGMALALKRAANEMQERTLKMIELKSYFEEKITERFEDIVINAQNAQHRLPHISSISFPYTSASDLLIFNLDISGISASSGSACSAGIEEDSHVLLAIGHEPKRQSIRFSFSHLNTIEEIDYLLTKLERLTTLKSAPHV